MIDRIDQIALIQHETAKALSLTVPFFLSIAADEVIEPCAGCCDARVRKWHKADMAQCPT
jgi:hypothetical protein